MEITSEKARLLLIVHPPVTDNGGDEINERQTVPWVWALGPFGSWPCTLKEAEEDFATYTTWNYGKCLRLRSAVTFKSGWGYGATKMQETVNSKEDSMSQFEEDIQLAVRNTILKIIKKGDWIGIDRYNPIKIGVDHLKRVYNAVDWTLVDYLVTAKVEQIIADKIVNSMTKEITNDVKQILCDRVLREELRSLLRTKIQTAVDATHTNG